MSSIPASTLVNTDSWTAVTDHMKLLLEESMEELDIKDVWYGDQDMLPRYPAICIEPVEKIRELAGVPFRTENTIRIYVFVYHATIPDNQVTRRDCDLRAEAVESLLHTDPQMGGLVIHGFCTRSEPGYASRGNTLMRVTRLTWEGLTKTQVNAV